MGTGLNLRHLLTERGVTTSSRPEVRRSDAWLSAP